MSEEYQRLQEAASAAESEIRELAQNHSVSSAADVAALERRLDLPAVTLNITCAFCGQSMTG